MNLFMKIFKIFQSTAHAVVGKFEDPVKLAEQGIRDLKKDFDESMQGVAKVKAIAINTKKELEVKKQIAIDYEQKALALLKKAQAGDLDSAEADRLATEALTKKQAALDEVQRLTGDLEKYSAMLKNMEAKILQLKTQIKNWEGELSTLKARATVAKTTKKINKQLARIDSNDTLSMLNDMKTKIQEEENLALAYEELTIQENGVDEEINKALGVRPEVAASLEDLKKSIGVNKQPELIEMQEKAPEAMTELEKMKKELEN